ncbi:MAG: plastocyanin/azurin family copper-binding protein [Gemmatimonadales bacterium]
MSTRFPLRGLVIAGATMSLLACGGEKRAEGSGADSDAKPVPGAVAPTGKVITIEMFSDETGNYFKPKLVEAHPGDVLRFTLGVGVHNVHFLPDSNPGVPNLPAASDLLQLPGQTFDVPVNFAAGKTYYFQCDPHAALGMMGHVKVE